MLDNPPLLTVHRGFRRAPPELLERFRGAQTSHLVDAMEGRGALDWRIKPLDPANAAFVGPALTAFAYPADVVGVMGALAEALARRTERDELQRPAHEAGAVVGERGQDRGVLLPVHREHRHGDRRLDAVHVAPAVRRDP